MKQLIGNCNINEREREKLQEIVFKFSVSKFSAVSSAGNLVSMFVIVRIGDF